MPAQIADGGDRKMHIDPALGSVRSVESTRSRTPALVVDAELELPAAFIMIARLNHQGPDRNFFRRDRVYWLDLCLTPRRPEAKARYCDLWAPTRFVELGSMIAIPPRKRLELRSAGGRHASLLCQIKEEVIDRWLPDTFSWTERRLETSLNMSNKTIQAMLLKLNHELRNPTIGSERLCEAVVAQLAIEIARLFVATSDVDAKGGLASWRLRLIDERIGKAGTPLPTVTELAELCKISPRQLSRAFRSSRGCSISEHLAQSRIQAAKRRLSSGGNIREVAGDLGFASQSSFTVAFHRATGMTPREYRSRLAAALGAQA
jgi:AraC family transcriptional regulator